MYGFAIGLFLGGVKHVDLYLHMMSQPPWDMNLDQSPGKPFYIIHYTYGMDYKLTGEFTPGKFGDWRFDKRTYGGTPVPRQLGEPPVNMKNDLVRVGNTWPVSIPPVRGGLRTHTHTLTLARTFYAHRCASSSTLSTKRRPRSRAGKTTRRTGRFRRRVRRSRADSSRSTPSCLRRSPEM
jgi:hypothetical protein